MNILSVHKAHPEHYYSQQALLEEFKRLWAKEHHNIRRVEQLHHAVSVGGRHLALKREEYDNVSNFTQSNDHFIRVGTNVMQNEALTGALANAGLTPQDVDAIFFVSVTGIATPSIDAKARQPTEHASRCEADSDFWSGMCSWCCGSCTHARPPQSLPQSSRCPHLC